MPRPRPLTNVLCELFSRDSPKQDSSSVERGASLALSESEYQKVCLDTSRYAIGTAFRAEISPIPVEELDVSAPTLLCRYFLSLLGLKTELQ